MIYPKLNKITQPLLIYPRSLTSFLAKCKLGCSHIHNRMRMYDPYPVARHMIYPKYKGKYAKSARTSCLGKSAKLLPELLTVLDAGFCSIWLRFLYNLARMQSFVYDLPEMYRIYAKSDFPFWVNQQIWWGNDHPRYNNEIPPGTDAEECSKEDNASVF